ncbi:hypothetical protein CEXT_17761 [Caerostris extrusa]|uniref:Uncharacterized protein n=1 Tax=Caerostris extrusa TaxID=172846 RepID=A0AAV4W1F3_CAEEX|nr:hypothetical protein CEXT_17761 [Caerostris extrusa]
MPIWPYGIKDYYLIVEIINFYNSPIPDFGMAPIKALATTRTTKKENIFSQRDSPSARILIGRDHEDNLKADKSSILEKSKYDPEGTLLFLNMNSFGHKTRSNAKKLS